MTALLTTLRSLALLSECQTAVHTETEVGEVAELFAFLTKYDVTSDGNVYTFSAEQSRTFYTLARGVDLKIVYAAQRKVDGNTMQESLSNMKEPLPPCIKPCLIKGTYTS